MLTEPARTVLAWAALGVAFGIAGAVAVAVVLATRPPAARSVGADQVLLILPVPVGFVSGLAAGTVVAAERGATAITVAAAVTALVGAAYPPLAPAPVTLGTAASRLVGAGWRRGVAVATVGMSAGVGLVGVPAQAVLGARGGPPAVALVGGALVGLLGAAVALPGETRMTQRR
ncbi:MAG: hypothetical protein KY462_00410 [Actinobacteria bacterium]|nr:hypothetical protein [Actinomycetota bacterium]